jgi:hypothetical protein
MKALSWHSIFGSWGKRFAYMVSGVIAWCILGLAIFNIIILFFIVKSEDSYLPESER